MINVKSFDEILEILLQNIADEGCGHASYVSNEEDITNLLKTVNVSTDAEAELINFDNVNDGYYVFELDYVSDGLITYSIWPAVDTEGIFNTNYGLCLVDECVPSSFEKDYATYGSDDEDYIKPIRVHMGDEPDCSNCDDTDCPNNKKSLKTSEMTRVDTNDDGTLAGFTKSWKNENSHFTYSFHSTNQEDVIEVMDRFDINMPK